MGLSLVRCPFCDRRYNVTGIPPGTRVLCTSCRTVLTVPGNRFVAPPPFWHRFIPRSGAAQAITALFGGLFLASVGFVALKESQGPALSVAPPIVAPPEIKKTDPPSGGLVTPGMYVSADLLNSIEEFRNPKFRVYSSEELRPFVLIGERNDGANLDAIFAQFEDLLPKLHRSFMSEFGDALGLEPIEGAPLPIVFYTRRGTYDDWWRQVYRRPSIPEVYGVFSHVPTRRVSLYYDPELSGIDSGRTREVLLHEAIHQLVDHYARKRKKSERHGAWWFQEGLGTYFEGYYMTAGELTLSPGKMTSRLPLARELVQSMAAEYQPIRKLMTWDVDDIWHTWLDMETDEVQQKRQIEKSQCHYAQVWAFVHFLCHDGDGRYRPFFLEYFRSELKGEGGFDEFNRLLNRLHPGLELEDLESQFKDYIKQL